MEISKWWEIIYEEIISVRNKLIRNDLIYDLNFEFNFSDFVRIRFLDIMRDNFRKNIYYEEKMMILFKFKYFQNIQLYQLDSQKEISR